LSAERNYASASTTLLVNAQSGHSEDVHDTLYGVEVHWPAQSRATGFAYLIQNNGMGLSSPSLSLTYTVPRTMQTALWDLQAFLHTACAFFRDPHALASESVHAIQLVVQGIGANVLTLILRHSIHIARRIVSP
jgi:hypothetical protein